MGLRGGGDLVRIAESSRGPSSVDRASESTCSPQLAYQVRRELQRFRPEIVHTWTEQANWMGRLAAVIERSSSASIASWRTLPRRPSLWSQVFEWAMAERTEAYVVNSRTALQFHAEQGLIQAKLRLIPEGVEIRPAATDAAPDPRFESYWESRLTPSLSAPLDR